jgi:hypothetical protein
VSFGSLKTEEKTKRQCGQYATVSVVELLVNSKYIEVVGYPPATARTLTLVR